MARLLTVLVVLAVVACVLAAPDYYTSGIANVEKGSIGIGTVSGGTFGADSFNIGKGGDSFGKGNGGHGGNIGTYSYGGPGGDAGLTGYG